MKIAIIQPYLFPYIGYFQMMKNVDVFIVFDDVQFIRRGWINRNRLLSNGSDYMFTLNVQKAPQETLINAIFCAESHIADKKKLLEQIQNFYKKAPFFAEIFPLLTEILTHEEANLNDFIVFSLQKIAVQLGITTPFVMASSLAHDKTTKGETRIIDIAKFYGATHYVNPIGGLELYNQEHFKNHDLELSFIKSKNVPYKQFNNEFIPFLSIIDVMMFNDKEKIDSLLTEFEWIK